MSVFMHWRLKIANHELEFDQISLREPIEVSFFREMEGKKEF